MSQPIEFYFDFSSPYGYLAAHQIDALGLRHGRAVAWRPVLLGAVFRVTGGKPLTETPLKWDYAQRDMQRFARLINVPFELPDAFPFAGTLPSRAFYWLTDSDPDQAKAFAQAVFHAAFADRQDVTSPEVLGTLAGRLGIDKAGLAAAVADPIWKDRLRQETDGAIAKGIFGSPIFVIDGEPFWGADRLDQVDRWLAQAW